MYEHSYVGPKLMHIPALPVVLGTPCPWCSSGKYVSPGPCPDCGTSGYLSGTPPWFKGRKIRNNDHLPAELEADQVSCGEDENDFVDI